MYHLHFGLNGPPFQFTSTPGTLYLSKPHREGLAALEWGLLHEATGFTLLVGESGIGKTTLVCTVLARSYSNLRVAYVASPKLNFDQMMQVVMSQLGRTVRDGTKLDLIESFTRLLDDLAPGEHLAIVIDEAQELADETLEEFRLLSNLDAGRERRLQLIFVGQPELLERMASPRMLSLNQRIGARVLLRPLQPAEAREYVECRLRARGGTTKKVFTSAALKHLLAHGRGIPRRMNVLCHNAMLLAFGAGNRRVELAVAKTAANQYENLLGAKPQLRNRPSRATRLTGRLAQAALAMAALALVVLGALYVWSSQASFAVSPSHAAAGGKAIRLTAGSNNSGPGVLPGPMALTRGRSSGAGVTFAVDWDFSQTANSAMTAQGRIDARTEGGRIAAAGTRL